VDPFRLTDEVSADSVSLRDRFLPRVSLLLASPLLGRSEASERDVSMTGAELAEEPGWRDIKLCVMTADVIGSGSWEEGAG